MRIFFLALFATLCSIVMPAKLFGQRMINFTTERGNAYFISDKKLSKRSKELKQFMFDITYVAHDDSVTVNFTTISPNPDDISNLNISNGEFTATASGVELLYHEPKGKHYLVRTTAKLRYDDLKKLFTSSQPAIFNITDKSGRQNSATYSLGGWEKEKKEFQKIFYMINI